jgi:hypothetical protein
VNRYPTPWSAAQRWWDCGGPSERRNGKSITHSMAFSTVLWPLVGRPRGGFCGGSRGSSRGSSRAHCLSVSSSLTERVRPSRCGRRTYPTRPAPKAEAVQ